jgi:hypothetical protein
LHYVTENQNFLSVDMLILHFLSVDTLILTMQDLNKKKSTTGYVFTVAAEPISWVTKLQSTVVGSTTEAEYVVVTQASKEVIWLKMVLEELRHKQKSVSLFCDS